MDSRADTLSAGRFGREWAFLSNPPQQGNPRSLPPSSYLPRSDRSLISPPPVVPDISNLNASRASLYRSFPTASIGGYTSATAPSQPVLITVHSANASDHLHPLPQGPPRKDDIMSNGKGLPPLSAFSIQSILAAIHEEIEPDVDAISEILGRSRLAPADLHESHMPPQGEIREMNVRPLQGIQEASPSNERLAEDNVLILNEDASLFDGSRAGSAAYDLLGRLQVMPRIRRQRSDPPITTRPTLPPQGMLSSPAVVQEVRPTLLPTEAPAEAPTKSSNAPRLLLQNADSDPSPSRPPRRPRTTNPVVSETYLTAGANGITISSPPVVSESGRHYPLYSYDESDLFETAPIIPLASSVTGGGGGGGGGRWGMPSMARITSPSGWRAWWYDDLSRLGAARGAEGRLRDVLRRSHAGAGERGGEEGPREPGEEEVDMYD